MLNGKLIAHIEETHGYLVKDWPPSPHLPPLSLALAGKDRLLILDDPMKGEIIDGVRKADGSIGWLRIGSRISKRKE